MRNSVNVLSESQDSTSIIVKKTVFLLLCLRVPLHASDDPEGTPSKEESYFLPSSLRTTGLGQTHTHSSSPPTESGREANDKTTRSTRAQEVPGHVYGGYQGPSRS